MNAADRYPTGRAIWRCDCCARLSHWTEGWGHYGSIMDEENGTITAIWCSDACMQALQREGIRKPRWSKRAELYAAQQQARLFWRTSHGY